MRTQLAECATTYTSARSLPSTVVCVLTHHTIFERRCHDVAGLCVWRHAACQRRVGAAADEHTGTVTVFTHPFDVCHTRSVRECSYSSAPGTRHRADILEHRALLTLVVPDGSGQRTRRAQLARRGRRRERRRPGRARRWGDRHPVRAMRGRGRNARSRALRAVPWRRGGAPFPRPSAGHLRTRPLPRAASSLAPCSLCGRAGRRRSTSRRWPRAIGTRA